jgi:hypothetical protein
MSKSGDGIGMWRIQQMMKLNNGECKVIFGEKSENFMGYDFGYNTFILRFRKN